MTLCTINFQKYFAYILASLIMVATYIFIPTIATPMSTAYLLIVTTFLGVNLATTLKTTNALPEGNYKPIKHSRYVVTILITLIIFITGIYIQKNNQIDLNGSLSSIGTTILMIIGLFIGELEGNKLLTFSNSGFMEKYQNDLGIGTAFKKENENIGFSLHIDNTGQ